MLQIKKILQDNNIDFVFYPKSESLPVDKIDLDLFIENYPQNLPSKIEIMFVPGIEEATSGLSLLQFYAILNLEINGKDAVKNELMKFISAINYTLATGAFILNPEEEYIYLKYNLSIDQEQDKDLELKLTRIIWLINRHFDTYANLFFELNNETLSFNDIKTKGLI
uniref:hypothetical protein n=1 Tax=Algoriphagus sp. TaxID=1872435 RepID=UPI004048311C